MEPAPGVAALEAGDGEQMDAAKDDNFPVIAAAVSLASGTGAADDAAVEAARAQLPAGLTAACNAHAHAHRSPRRFAPAGLDAP